MGFPLVKKWQVYSAKKKIDQLTRKIFHSIFDESTQAIEFGNLRRSEEWGILKNNEMQWTILVDIIAGKPIQYIIAYSLLEKKYSCYAVTAKNNFSSVFQFSTSDIKELDYRLTELANHIPSLRERILREYMYNESKNAPGKKWYQFFVGRDKTEAYLVGKMENLYNQNKISKNEMTRLKNYIADLV